jgi:hypothetical protein
VEKKEQKKTLHPDFKHFHFHFLTAAWLFKLFPVSATLRGSTIVRSASSPI